MTSAIIALSIKHASLSVRAHSAQVALSCHTNMPQAMALCHAHDLIEDTDLTLEEVRDYLISLEFEHVDEFIEALDSITRRDSEPYFNYIKRVSMNELATRVKIADLRVNLKRCDGRPEYESLARRYTKALSELS